MGMSVESSNVVLPTSRLAHRVKIAQHKRALRNSGKPVPSEIQLHGIEHRSDRRGRLGAVARLLRRVSEEAYRQIVSWVLQWRGQVVLYDRHFLFDALPRPSDRTAPDHRLTDRIHNWFLYRLYPRPDLVILLDAPPVVPVSDPVQFIEATDGVLFMVMAGRTPKDLVIRGVDILKNAGANLLGVVANNLAEVLPYYYDHKYYGYHEDRQGKKRKR